MKQTVARIYVVGSLRHLDSLAAGSRSWWCVEHKAEKGELGVIYIKGKGLVLLFRYLELAEKQEFLCKDHGLATGNIEILARIDHPIHAKVMREHPVLSKLPALARSFQRKSFHLDEPFLSLITGMLGWVPSPPARPARATKAKVARE